MDPAKNATNKQFRLELTLPEEITNDEPATVTITSPSEGAAKQLVVRMLGNETKFIARDGGVDIYHPKVNAGKTPLGWIGALNVPERFSVKNTSQFRLSERIAA